MHEEGCIKDATAATPATAAAAATAATAAAATAATAAAAAQRQRRRLQAAFGFARQHTRGADARVLISIQIGTVNLLQIQ